MVIVLFWALQVGEDECCAIFLILLTIGNQPSGQAALPRPLKHHSAACGDGSAAKASLLEKL